MKLDNFVPFGRPQSGTVIIQLMTVLDVSKTKYQNSNTKAVKKAKQCAYFYVLKSHVTMHILKKYITDSSLKMLYVGICVEYTLSFLY